MSTQPVLVPLDEALLPQIAEIERECFLEPWSENSLRMLLPERGYGAAVLKDGKVVSYGGMLFALDEAQITDIATLPAFRRMGFAKQILTNLISVAGEKKMKTLSMEVRASNEPALNLYRSFGFFPVGQRKNFYRFPTEDAVLLLLKL